MKNFETGVDCVNNEAVSFLATFPGDNNVDVAADYSRSLLAFVPFDSWQVFVFL